MRFTKTPSVVKKLFPRLTWNLPEDDKSIYLTFDDGPEPGITDFVLKELQKYNASATFFCVGENVKKHPALFQEIVSKGHSVGNHTYNHLNGWKSRPKEYLINISKCSETFDSNLFRPPYGKLPLFNNKTLLNRYKIIMWDVLTHDYDIKVSREKCLSNATSNIKPGSIIVFHDSLKAWKNLQYALPRSLEFFSTNGFKFKKIEFRQD
jgi:peptidoglycan-N-acetylglucosamine deacetylase